MTTKTADFTGWEFDDVFDNVAMPGAFVSKEPAHPITIHIGGVERTVIALNWNHAQFVALNQAAEEAGGDLHKCELCGARLRYAALFFDAMHVLHIVGRECANRVQAGVQDREEWAIAQALKDAKDIHTKNGPRVKVDLREPDGFRLIPYNERPAYTSTWTPKVPMGRGRAKFGKPRVTIWAENRADLMDNVRAFRAFLKERGLTTARRITKRPSF